MFFILNLCIFRFLETLRKYPPFIALRRMAQANYKIPDTEIVIEKGVSVVVPVYSIHHDPDYYPGPEKFDPNRFTPEEIKKRHPMAWLAFGDGPRNCIALRFGMMQTRVGIISLLRHFKFLPCSQTPLSIAFGSSPIVLSPKDPVHLKIEAI